jgi:hypothetical protein
MYGAMIPDGGVFAHAVTFAKAAISTIGLFYRGFRA